MTTETIEVIEAPETVATEAETAPLTEQEAIGIAVAGLRELIGYKYHFCNRWSDTMGDRLPPAIKREQAQRLRYEAAIKVLEGLAWWEEAKGAKDETKSQEY